MRSGNWAWELLHNKGSDAGRRRVLKEQAWEIAISSPSLIDLSDAPRLKGVTLEKLQDILLSRRASTHQRRPSVLLEALHHLQHVGLVATTANQLGDDLSHRRYWRAPTSNT